MAAAKRAKPTEPEQQDEPTPEPELVDEPAPGAEPTPDPDEPPPAPPGVERFDNGWSLSTSSVWQVSIAPDGLLMLPRHLRPEEVGEFCAAATAAAAEGLLKVAWNRAHTTPMPDLTGVSPRAVVTEGPPPRGHMPMTVRGEGPGRPTGSIGRRRRGVNPQTDPRAMPGQPRNARRR